jgi:hypothetical protein
MRKVQGFLLHVAAVSMLCVLAAVFGCAQEAQAVMDEMAQKAAKGLDVRVDYDLARCPVKTIFLTFSSHWDREYTDPDDVERDQLIRLVDNLIDTAQANPDFKWSEEATWHIEAWLRSNPSPKRQEELFSLIRSGRVSVGATQQMLMGLPDEINGRAAYEAANLADRYNLKPFELAVAADYVGYSWNLIQPLARSGVRYLLNSHHIVFMPHDDIKIKDEPFWWEGPDGSRLLVWRMEYTSAIYPYGVNPQAMRFFNGKEIGEEANQLTPLRLTEVALKNQLKKIASEGYDKDAILVIYSHDCVPPEQSVGLIQHVREWNRTYATPKIVIATPEEFFRHMEQKYGGRLPVYRGEYRQWFKGPGYDFVPGRRAALDVLDAEKYWSVDSLFGGRSYPTWMLGQELTDLIESAAHGGGAWQATRLNEEYTQFRRDELNANIVARAYYLRKTGLAAVGQRVLAEQPSYAVFNSLSWDRSGVVEIPVMDWTFPRRAGLVDPATSRPVPCEWVPWEPPSTEGMEFGQIAKRASMGEAGYGKIRFFAPDVPPMG